LAARWVEAKTLIGFAAVDFWSQPCRPHNNFRPHTKNTIRATINNKAPKRLFTMSQRETGFSTLRSKGAAEAFDAFPTVPVAPALGTPDFWKISLLASTAPRTWESPAPQKSQTPSVKNTQKGLVRRGGS
jgi:hypothetical protein